MNEGQGGRSELGVRAEEEQTGGATPLAEKPPPPRALEPPPPWKGHKIRRPTVSVWTAAGCRAPGSLSLDLCSVPRWTWALPSPPCEESSAGGHALS